MLGAATNEGEVGSNGGAERVIEIRESRNVEGMEWKNLSEFTNDSHAKQLDDRLKAYFIKASVTANIVTIATLFEKMRHKMSWQGVVACLFFAFSSLLNFAGLYYSGRIGPLVELTDNQRRRVNSLCTMAYVSTVLLIAAALVLLHFVDGRWRWDAIALAVSVLVLLAYAFQRNTENRSPPPGERRFWWLGHIKAASYYYMDGQAKHLKHLFDFSAEAVCMGFSGQVGAVIGYVKDSSNKDKGYISPQYLMFVGNVLVLLLALVASVPPKVYPEQRRGDVLVGLRSGAYVAVVVLAMACFMATKEILSKYIAVPFFVQVLLGMLCLFEQRIDGKGQRRPGGAEEGTEEDAVLSPDLVGFIYSPMIGLVMASYSITGGTKSMSWCFQVFVLFMFCTILTHSIRMLIVLQIPDVRAFPAKVWTKATYGLTAITCVFVFLVAMLHLDKLQNFI